MLMFLLADLSSMKPNCLRQPDDDAVSTVRARCALEVDDDEPVKSSRLMLTRCPEGASNNQGRSRLPHAAVVLSSFDVEGDKKTFSEVTAT